MLDIALDWSEFPDRQLFARAADHMQFGTARALTDVAIRSRDNVQSSMNARLDRPREFTRRGMYVRAADRRGRLEAEVGFKLIQEGYLGLVEEGGLRTPKGGRRAVSTPVGAKLDRYGNVPRGFWRKADANPKVFGGTVKGVKGLWLRPTARQEKAGKGLTLLVRYDREGRRQAPQLGFAEIVTRTVGRHLGRTWAARVREAFQGVGRP